MSNQQRKFLHAKYNNMSSDQKKKLLKIIGEPDNHINEYVLRIPLSDLSYSARVLILKKMREDSN